MDAPPTPSKLMAILKAVAAETDGADVRTLQTRCARTLASSLPAGLARLSQVGLVEKIGERWQVTPAGLERSRQPSH